MKRLLLLGALALAADPVPPTVVPLELTSPPTVSSARLSDTPQPEQTANCDKSELLLKIWKALKPEGQPGSARSRLDGFQLEQTPGDGGLRVVFRLQVPARASPTCRAAIDRLIDMADGAYHQLVQGDICAASKSQLNPISPFSPFDSLSPLAPQTPVSPLAPLSPSVNVLPAVPVLPSSNPLDDIIATLHDGSDRTDVSPSSLQDIINKLAKATLDADKKPAALPSDDILNDGGSSLIGKLQEILSMENKDSPLVGQRPALIELTYVLRRPKPLVYQPYYYVKYHIPFRTFVANFRKLLAEQPYASRSPEQFYRELVSLSTVAEVSPDLRVYDQRDIGRLVFGNGTLVDARLLALSRSAAGRSTDDVLPPLPGVRENRFLNVSSDTLGGTAPQEVVDVLMKKLNVSLQPPPPLNHSVPPQARRNSLVPAVLSSLSSMSPSLLSAQSQWPGLGPSPLNTLSLLSRPSLSQLYSVPAVPQYSSFPTPSNLQYPPVYSSYPNQSPVYSSYPNQSPVYSPYPNQSPVYRPSYSSFPDPQSPVIPSYSSYASAQAAAASPLSDSSLLQSLSSSML